MFDAIIVGARCAGSPTAMLLARRGYRVLLLDKAATRIEAPTAHLLHPPAVARLKSWGLLERLVQTGCPAIERTSADLGEFRLIGQPPPLDGTRQSLCPPRPVLDQILLESAVQAGVEYREGFTITELVSSEGQITGIRGRTADGRDVMESGRVVVGADGMYSMVARSVKAPEYDVVEPLTCHYQSWWRGVPMEGLELYPRAGRFVTAAPTIQGLTVINVFAPRAEFRAFRAETEQHFLETLERTPDLLERVRAGTRAGAFVGTADTTNFFRQSAGPGWALAGDAGCHKDPVSAHGIADAFRDAETLACALHAGFSGHCSIEAAMSAYEADRDAAVRPMYELTCEMARLAPPSRPMQALYDALRDNPADTDQFFGMLAGTVPVRDFFAAENQQRILRSSNSGPNESSRSISPPNGQPHRSEITCA